MEEIETETKKGDCWFGYVWTLALKIQSLENATNFWMLSLGSLHEYFYIENKTESKGDNCSTPIKLWIMFIASPMKKCTYDGWVLSKEGPLGKSHPNYATKNISKITKSKKVSDRRIYMEAMAIHKILELEQVLNSIHTAERKSGWERDKKGKRANEFSQ